MKYRILCVCAVFGFAVAITPAQTKNSMSARVPSPTSSKACLQATVRDTSSRWDKESAPQREKSVAWRVKRVHFPSTETLRETTVKPGAST